MKEIEEKLKAIIERVDRSMQIADSINQKLDTLLEAIQERKKQ